MFLYLFPNWDTCDFRNLCLLSKQIIPRNIAVLSTESFCNFPLPVPWWLYLFFSIQYYIASPVFDLWYSVICIQSSAFLHLLYICIGFSFFSPIAENTYSYWISSWFCWECLSKVKIISAFFPTSSISNPSQFILRGK